MWWGGWNSFSQSDLAAGNGKKSQWEKTPFIRPTVARPVSVLRSRIPVNR